ncbi:MAG: uncharacterized protein JWO36_6661, partial [Myxococcales bacterium]|nr:uncharacterized protein [Myxococcales bacterium]
MRTPATTMLLTRLARAGLVRRLRPGLWWLDSQVSNRYALVETLTTPFPSYVSLLTALYLHGMIEQIPSVIYSASLARTQRIRTSDGVFSIHHIAAELFEGFDSRTDGTKLATPEKALFDVAYLSGGRSRLFAHLPELELSATFDPRKLRVWIDRVGSARRRSMVETRLRELLARAAGPPRQRTLPLASRSASASRRTGAAARGARAGRTRG